MFDLKPIHKDAIPAALEKAMRYRLLNEPAEAESICLDVLNAEPDNQLALTTLLLALTDRFGATYAVGSAQAQEVLAAFAIHMNRLTTRALSVNDSPRRGLRNTYRERAFMPTICFLRRLPSTKKQTTFVRRATMTPGCVGTPAYGSSNAIN